MADDEQEIIFRYKDGRRIPIRVKKTSAYMNKLIRDNAKVKVEIPSVEAQSLSKEEYEKIKDEFYNTLTTEEKNMLSNYTSWDLGLGTLNAEDHDMNKHSYRFLNDKNKQGFTTKMLSDYEAFDTNLDKKATYIKVDKDDGFHITSDDKAVLNYKRMTGLQEKSKQLDEIFEKKGVSFDKDIIVYRKGHEDLDKLEKGYVRRGYTSTSAYSRINKQTPGGLVLGENEFEIVVPAGMKVLPLENVVADVDLIRQHEILLPKNLQLEPVLDKSREAYFNSEKVKFVKSENRYLVKAKQVDKKNIKGRYLK